MLVCLHVDKKDLAEYMLIFFFLQKPPLRNSIEGDWDFHLFLLIGSNFATFWVKVPFKLKMLLKRRKHEHSCQCAYLMVESRGVGLPLGRKGTCWK